MMQKLKLLPFVFCIILTAGCSGNLFKGLEGKGGIENRVFNAQRALDTGNYAEAERLYQEIYDSTGSKDAAAGLAQAKLGNAGVDIGGIVKTVLDAPQNQGALTTIYNILPSKDKLEVVQKAADLLNEASPTDKNVCLTAAVANALTAVLKVVDKFDKDGIPGIGDNEVSSFDTDWNNIKGVVLTYADKAVNFALTAIGTSQEDIKEIKEKIDAAKDTLNNLTADVLEAQL